MLLKIFGALAAAAAAAAQQPLISIPVRTPAGPVHNFNLFEGDNILQAAGNFIAANSTSNTRNYALYSLAPCVATCMAAGLPCDERNMKLES